MGKCNQGILYSSKSQTGFCILEKKHDGKCVASKNLLTNLSDELLNHISVTSDHLNSFVKNDKNKNNLKLQSQKTKDKITTLQSKINATAEQIKNLK